MGGRTGTFKESYAQDMALFSSGRNQGAIVLLLVVPLCRAVIFKPPDADYPYDHGHSGNQRSRAEHPDRLLRADLHRPFRVHGRGRIYLGHPVRPSRLAVLWSLCPAPLWPRGLAGLLFGLPSLKIKGFYLIMATIAAQFIIIWFIIQLRGVTGGTDGLLVPKPTLAGISLSSKVNYYYLVMVVVVLATFSAHNIVRTRSGRAFIAIRDNEKAAEVMGVKLWSYKLQAFFIGCIYAGAAGSLLVHYVRFASIEQFPFMDSVWYLGMLIVGGMGNTTGAIMGVVALKVLDELVTVAGPILAAAVAPQAAASLALISHGLVIIIFLIFEPRGLHHTWEMIKNYFEVWPFSHQQMD